MASLVAFRSQLPKALESESPLVLTECAAYLAFGAADFWTSPTESRDLDLRENREQCEGVYDGSVRLPNHTCDSSTRTFTDCVFPSAIFSHILCFP